ncbi:MAG: energy-coupling factor ABC transporter permease [Syntrophaceae bacterium]
MHIPDGFLSASVSAATWAAAAGGVGFSLNKAARTMKDRTIPLMGITAAFLFSAQMVNFPIGGGTSGHLLGGALAAILLGPFAGTVTLACVLVFQCLLFQDGGLTALGANIFNMALGGTLGGYCVFRAAGLLFRGEKGTLIAAAIASWFSVVLASALCALELAVSGISPIGIVLPAMAGIHSIIGIGEAAISVAVLSFVMKARPDLVYLQQVRTGEGRS